MTSPMHCSNRRWVLAAVGIWMACTACGSKEAAHAPGDTGERDQKSARSCADLFGSWIEVEPIEGASSDEPEIDKVKATSPGTRLDFERDRLTIASGVERSYTRVAMEQAGDGRCVLRARDSLGRPLEIDVSLLSERMMRLRNVLEPKSPPSLFERR
jgi:hypothetical protein